MLKRVTLLSVLLLALPLLTALTGCRTPPDTLPTLHGNGTLPRSIAATPTRLEHFRAPPTLAGLAGDGEITHPGENGWRQWLFGDAETRLKVTLYGLPGGWDELSATRIVSGHYGQLRQDRVNRVYNSADQSIRFLHERFFDLEGRVTASGAYLINRPNQHPRYETLLLTLEGDHFVRLETASRQRDTRELLRLSKRALAEFRAHQEKAAPPDEQR